jgi:NitT/TauT family transport system permease protein
VKLPGGAPAEKTGRRRASHRLAGHLVFVAVLAALWEVGSRVSGVSGVLFPPFSEVIRSLGGSLLEGELPERIGFSLLLIAEGLGMGIVIALLLSVGARAHRGIASAVESMTAFFHPLPGIALLPLVILWAGTGTAAVVVIIVHSVVWPLWSNLTAGFRSVPPHLLDVARNFRLSPPRMILQLLIPSSFPFLLAGLRIGWARAWRALIAAEMVFGAVGARGGIGWFIFQKRVFMDTTGLFAGIVTVMVIGVVVEELVFETIERVTVRRWGTSV